MAPTRNKVDVDVKAVLTGRNAGGLCAADRVQVELLVEPCTDRNTGMKHPYGVDTYMKEAITPVTARRTGRSNSNMHG